jgi:hypothetical protein
VSTRNFREAESNGDLGDREPGRPSDEDGQEAGTESELLKQLDTSTERELSEEDTSTGEEPQETLHVGRLSPQELTEKWHRYFSDGNVDALAGLYRSEAFFELSDLSQQAYGRGSIRELLRRALDSAYDELEVNAKASDTSEVIAKGDRHNEQKEEGKSARPVDPVELWEPVVVSEDFIALEYRIGFGTLKGEGLALLRIEPGGIAFDKRFLVGK